jgi:imidazolonepropionase-like amidohydrolase/Tol biopolymer transport system component
MKFATILTLVCSLCTGTAMAWDITDPPGPKRAVEVSVDEGTWMSLDVSPDGKTIAFDLLGDVFLLPIKGGEATAIASGAAWQMQPRFSPDGSKIAFASDAAGTSNLWVMNADGSSPRAISDEQFHTLNNPTWTADGNYVAGRKNYTTWRSLGTGEIWLYHLSGGKGAPLVERRSPTLQKELGEPIFSDDGKYLYYTENVTPGDLFVYAQDSNRQSFQIKRYEVATGKVVAAVTGNGGAVRATPSPDGRYMAFVRRLREQSALFLKDLESGEIELLYDELDRDTQETWATQGVYPNMDWTPDSKTILFWAGGKIRQLKLADKSVKTIPFSVAQTHQVMEPRRFDVAVAPDEFATRMVRWPVVSPDGKTVAFESLGRIYTRRLPDGEAKLLTRDRTDAFELYPSWSRDGRWITFVRWTDQQLGAVHKVAARGGASTRLSEQPGYYRRPSFSPDGSLIVVEKGASKGMNSPNWTENPGIYLLSAKDGSDFRRVTDDGRDPHFGASNERIFLTRTKNASNIPGARNVGGEEHLVSVGLTGSGERSHAFSDRATRLLASPDENWLAFRENYNVYVTPLPASPTAMRVGVEERDTADSYKPAYRIQRISADAGQFPAWAGESELTWSMGPTAWEADVSRLYQGEAAPVREIDLSRKVVADKPSGVVALTGARILTMDKAGEVIEKGTIIVRDNRIAAVGAAADVVIPPDAEVVDLAGKTIMPGLIDAHAHGPQGEQELVPQQNWLNLAYLALGVTTIHDPANRASDIFAAAELQSAGKILAPRIFSTGEIIYGARSEQYAIIDSLDDARGHVRRLKAQGAISVKNYNQPRREQRQQVNVAAQEEGMMVVAEGGSLFHLDMNLIADGVTGIEHNVPISRMYEDVLQYWSRTPVGYTLTLNVNYGGLPGENYWYQQDDVWKHPLLSRYVPPRTLQPRALRRTMAPESEYGSLTDSAANGKRLADRGVDVNIGGHGQREGLGGHWEIWSFTLGGMSPMQALRTATSAPAHYLGMEADLGSVETGKLADLVILDANPLADIRNTDDIDKVMLNGRLYEAESLDEVVTGDSKLRDLWWWGEPQAELVK